MRAAPQGGERSVSGDYVDAFGGRYYRISNVDRLTTFFMNVVSSSDLWLFVASNCGLTAGRVSAEHALFPYETVDRIYDGAGIHGPVSAFWVDGDGGPSFWEPFARRTDANKGVIRNLYKSVEGDRVWFEEINPSISLAFRYGWSTSEAHGLVRRCELENLDGRPREIRLLDGLHNLLPSGIPLLIQNSRSCLADAYKTAELVPGTTLAVFALAAAIVDRAVPLESLRASIVCSTGLDSPVILLSDRQLGLFYEGRMPEPEPRCRGIRTSYFVASALRLEPLSTRRWTMVADVELSQSDVTRRAAELASGGFEDRVMAAAEDSTRRLRRLVGAADGLQAGAKEATTAHHFANVLFNIMRGGIFQDGHAIPGPDFARVVGIRNAPAARRFAGLLSSLPESMTRQDFIGRVAAAGDRDLERLAQEYLPLTFSRRHGDPSRPWNRFSIRVRDSSGRRFLGHEGNWRDIFQNWEALGLSHPEFLESVVAKFVNASTVDGYNPYRVTDAGIDWEVPDHEDPWSSIGYWGDHQVIYLLKLLEWSGRFHPGSLGGWLRRELFSYADVPYRIAGYAAMRADPRSTIEFDEGRHRETERRAATQGSDARLVQGPGGGVLHVNLTEKLLVLVLTRLTNFVPGGGIWMNTQRPEWNDANNALVGNGVSVVTLGYLRRMLVHFRSELLPLLGSAPVTVSEPVAALLRSLKDAYDHPSAAPEACASEPRARRLLLDLVAEAGADYRRKVYADGLGARTGLPVPEIGRLLDSALSHVEYSLRANRREDGLYHSYNLLEFTEEPAGVELHRLDPMLEGQVSILSSGLLAPSEAVALLQSLRRSALHRPDLDSYLLYPDRQLPGFLERNIIPQQDVARCALLRDLAESGDDRLVTVDAGGKHRFAPHLSNAAALDRSLSELEGDPRWSAAVTRDSDKVRAVYERVFNHRAFTGRSSSMFGYEGLGSVYWHMVAKLLLAVQENLFAAEAAQDPASGALAEIYRDVRAGLGFNKTPSEYGAVPADPYSHTPGHSGAQQPGMTGQVKEEILTRLGELGVRVADGSVSFVPTFLNAEEFLPSPSSFGFIGNTGTEGHLELPPGSLGFTFCGTPVVYRLGGGEPTLGVHFADGSQREAKGAGLDRATSARLFSRDGTIRRIEVVLGAGFRVP